MNPEPTTRRLFMRPLPALPSKKSIPAFDSRHELVEAWSAWRPPGPAVQRRDELVQAASSSALVPTLYAPILVGQLMGLGEALPAGHLGLAHDLVGALLDGLRDRDLRAAPKDPSRSGT
jgi:hypothetical protein